MKLEKSVLLQKPIDEVFAFCASKSGFLQHFPYRVTWLTGPEQWTQSGIELTFKFYIAKVPIFYHTEITQFEHNKVFVDVMRFGPYKYFIHEHHFEETKQGTLYRDKLNFSAGFLGIFDPLFAKPMTNYTFDQRHKLMTRVLNHESS
ncbi:MAG: hypothetical protein HRT53_08430 [Colwellia sp.]|nr:hypothetical protein [Colwellia sp.]